MPNPAKTRYMGVGRKQSEREASVSLWSQTAENEKRPRKEAWRPSTWKEKAKASLAVAEEGSLGGGEVEGTMRPGSKEAVRATEQNCLKLLPPRYDY